MLRGATKRDEVGVGIKRVLLGIEAARQSPDEMVERFADVMKKTVDSKQRGGQAAKQTSDKTVEWFEDDIEKDNGF